MTDILTDDPARTARPALPRGAEGWGWLLASGVLGVLLGTLALLVPGLAVLGASLALGCGLLALGACEVAAATRSGAGPVARPWLVALGLLALVAGTIVVLRPLDGVLALVVGLAVWFLGLGAHDLLVAVSQREHRVGNAVLGTWSLLVAVALVAWPATAVSTIALLVALGFLLRGGGAIGLAVALRRAARAS